MRKNETREVNDFGEVIQGAWKFIRGKALTHLDIEKMTDAEKEKYLVKQNVWIKPDYEALKEEGVGIRQLMYVKMVYDSLPKGGIRKEYGNFVDYITSVKEVIEEVKDDSETEFRNKVNNRYYFKELYKKLDLGTDPNCRYVHVSRENRFGGLIENKFIKNASANMEEIKQRIVSNHFLMNDEEYFMFMSDVVQIGGDTNNVIQTRAWKNDGNPYLVIYGESESGNPTMRNYCPSDAGLVQDGDWVIFSNLTSATGKALPCLPAKTKEQALLNREIEAKAYAKACQKTEVAEAETKARKKRFQPPYLTEIVREGEDFRNGKDILETQFLKDIKVRGGQFGNWENNEERAKNLNACSDAFKDLAVALNVDSTKIGLGGKLGIAFGARGRGNALAHYEPLHNVINLTKMRGAGSLAHEWGHALDYYTRDNQKMVEKMKEVTDVMFYQRHDEDEFIKQILQSDYIRYLYRGNGADANDKLEEELTSIIHEAIKPEAIDTYKAEFNLEIINGYVGFAHSHADGEKYYFANKFYSKKYELLKTDNYTLPMNYFRLEAKLYSFWYMWNSEDNLDKQYFKSWYYQDSAMFDGSYARDTMGYWASDIEMFARAFACYIYDKLKEKGIRDDYLCGHAYCGSPVPRGDEKQVIFKKIDEFIDLAKEEKLL